MVTTLNIPKELRDAPRWGSWHYDAQQRKVPDQEVNQLGKWKNLTAVKSERKAFVFAEVDPWFSIDIDFKNFPSKKPSPEQQKIIDTAVANGMYVERSVSGLGYHLWARANKKKWPRAAKKLKALVRNDLGIEIYAQSRYFIMTGNADKPFENGLPDATKFMLALFARYEKKRDAPAAPQQRDKPSVELVQRALACISPDVGYHEWKEIVGFGLQDWDYEEGFKLWDEWSSKAIVKTYPGTDSLRYQWDTGFQPGGGVTISSVLDLAKAYGFSDFKSSAADDFKNKPLPVDLDAETSALLDTEKSVEEKKTQPSINPISSKELMQKDFPELLWIVDRLISEGNTCLAARPKIGKSWFALQLAVCVATGVPFLGRKTRKSKVLYMGLEDSYRRLQSRLKTLEQAHTLSKDGSLLLLDQNVPRVNKGGYAWLKEYLTQHPDLKLVIVDTIAAFQQAYKNDRDKYQYDYDTIQMFTRLAAEFHVSIILIAHTRKAEGEDFLDLVMGTSGVTGGADTIMVIRRKRADIAGTLHSTSREGEEVEWAIQLDLNLGGWLYLGDANKIALDGAKGRVTEALKKAGKPLSTTELANRLAITPRALRYTTAVMLDSGTLEIDKDKFFLPT